LLKRINANITKNELSASVGTVLSLMRKAVTNRNTNILRI
jgi:hypothetical protein